MKLLGELAAKIDGARIVGSPETAVKSIEHDSRKVSKGTLFVCIEGAHVDGHSFIPEAIEAGASVIMTTRTDVTAAEEVAVLIVDDIQGALAEIVPFFYDYPARSLTVIGITGTNGKTTTSYLLCEIFRRSGKRTGVIGTIQILIEEEIIHTHNTTPDVIELQGVLSLMRERQVDIVVMEVSSHALAQNRVAGIDFDAAVFTNLTQDHLDYHQTLWNYAEAKSRLFAMLAAGEKTNKLAALNADDNHSALMREKLAGRVPAITYGMSAEAKPTMLADKVELRADGMKINLHSELFKGRNLDFEVQITGIFNVYNIMAAVAVAAGCGVDMDVIKEALEDFGGVAGRFELIRCGQDFAVAVDYAHTPDGMENVIKTAREVTSGRLITVFGCGGDRDKTKRPLMGEIAAKLSDVVVVTSDNPRSENPEMIMDDILVGVNAHIANKLLVTEVDRRAAITAAVTMADSADMVVILGKGHENYQILGDKIIHFDDREVAREAIRDKLGYGRDYCSE